MFAIITECPQVIELQLVQDGYVETSYHDDVESAYQIAQQANVEHVELGQ